MDGPLIFRKHLALGLEAGIRVPKLRRQLTHPMSYQLPGHLCSIGSRN